MTNEPRKITYNEKAIISRGGSRFLGKSYWTRFRPAEVRHDQVRAGESIIPKSAKKQPMVNWAILGASTEQPVNV